MECETNEYFNNLFALITRISMRNNAFAQTRFYRITNRELLFIIIECAVYCRSFFVSGDCDVYSLSGST